MKIIFCCPKLKETPIWTVCVLSNEKFIFSCKPFILRLILILTCNLGKWLNWQSVRPKTPKPRSTNIGPIKSE